MPGCAAVNCNNRSEKGYRLFKFPADNKRRLIWLQNTRRKNWIPTSNSYLCEIHFEESQFELKRADGWRKLKPNAVPTIFSIPNPPARIDPPPRISNYKLTIHSRNATASSQKNFSLVREPLSQLESDVNVDNMPNTLNDNDKRVDNISLEEKVLKLEQENEALRRQLHDARKTSHATIQQENEMLLLKRDVLAAFLNPDQIKMLQDDRLKEWSKESIIKALKFKFALGVHGYDYLRQSGYPLPAYSTIMRKVQDLKFTFGIFEDVLELLRFKIKNMDEVDKFSILSYDEMCISEQIDYDQNLGEFSGYVTLGENKSAVGQKIFVVVIRGIKSRWKQIIACHVTRKEFIDPKIIQKFILDCIDSAERCGLCVLLLSSDLDNRNKALYTSLNICATRDGCAVNSFYHNEHKIYVEPDPCHLLKNCKSAVLRQLVYLPTEFIEMENLPTNVVNGTYVSQLWKYEQLNVGEKSLLHHIKKEDIEPSNFDKMHVGAAIRFFSPKTASALNTAVKMNILPKAALTTSKFFLIIAEWFAILASKVRKTSITARNCDKKYIFLHSVINLFQKAVFHEGWKPLNYGFVLATLSFCDVAEYLFASNYEFLLGDRFLQDGTENIFSQIRRKEGLMPTALKCIRAIKSISVSQFVSDRKRTNYMNDSDEFLLDFSAKKKKLNKTSPLINENESTKTPKKEIKTSNSHFCVQNYEFEEFSELFSHYETNSIFYLAGSTTNSVIKHVCNTCSEFLKLKNVPDNTFIKNAKIYTQELDKGGLKEPCKQTLHLILHCEHYYKLYQNVLIRNNNCDLIKDLCNKVKIDFPMCCNVKYRIIKHFFNVRSYCYINYYKNSKQRNKIYGSASIKKNC